MSNLSISVLSSFLNTKNTRNLGTDCIEWNGKTSNGYGHTSLGGAKGTTARIVYTAVFGDIPEGLVIDHLCRNRKCCNIKHLEVVSQRDNISRGECFIALHIKKTSCVNGHEFTKSNTYLYKQRNGVTRRQCRECVKERNKKCRKSETR